MQGLREMGMGDLTAIWELCETQRQMEQYSMFVLKLGENCINFR